MTRSKPDRRIPALVVQLWIVTGIAGSLYFAVTRPAPLTIVIATAVVPAALIVLAGLFNR